MINYNSLTDLELMGCLRNDDHAAFEEIFNRYNKLLYSHAYNKIRDEAITRDLVQDTFLTLWEKRSTVQSLHLAGLLFRMVRNNIINLVSREKVAVNYTESLKWVFKEDYHHADHLIREKQLSDIIEAEIAALPPRMREVFELRRKEHLTNKEIAERLGLSEHTVADQIKKSLRILRVKIGLSIVFAIVLGKF